MQQTMKEVELREDLEAGVRHFLPSDVLSLLSIITDLRTQLEQAKAELSSCLIANKMLVERDKAFSEQIANLESQLAGWEMTQGCDRNCLICSGRDTCPANPNNQRKDTK
jgi:hypothetical protein